MLTGIRGCDLAPKNPLTDYNNPEDTAERGLTAFLRYCVLNPADEREVDMPGAFFQSQPPKQWRPSQFGHFPQHWYSHIMHGFEIIGYCHTNPQIRSTGMQIYKRLVTNMHLNIESYAQMHTRLVEDRIKSGEVVS